MKNAKGDRGSKLEAVPGKRARRSRSRRPRKAMGLAGFMEENLPNMRIADIYRPLKKPVTLRLDADVLAWFKRDGRRYQTRINAALRRVMEREMRIAS